MDLDEPVVMGIVNLTPDSFSDGGRWLALEANSPNSAVVLRQLRKWVGAGLRLVDLGGESTRPGAEPVVEAVELARLRPALEAILGDEALSEVVVSVDTRHASVARACLGAGANVINDVSGLADEAMAEAVAEFGAGLVIGHMRGVPANMQKNIRFEGLFDEIEEEIGRSVERARSAGVAPESIVIDPCVGFGKTAKQSAALIASAQTFVSRLGYPVLIGASRKRVLREITQKGTEELQAASVAAALVAVEHGARIARVHDVEATLEAFRVRSEIRRALAAEQLVQDSGAASSDPA